MDCAFSERLQEGLLPQTEELRTLELLAEKDLWQVSRAHEGPSAFRKRLVKH